MITENTVFVLGAGASVPYGFPSGQDLSELIISKFWNNYYKLFNSQGHSEEQRSQMDRELTSFVNAFKKSGRSIDFFLSTNRSNQDYCRLGKLAIALYILKSEDDCRQKENYIFRKDWFKIIFDGMINGCYNPEDYVKIKENKVSFITFNYDRLLEDLLFDSYTNTYATVDRECLTKILREIPLFHVYGQLSFLKWQKENAILDNIVNFGQQISLSALNNCIKNIYTIYQEREQIRNNHYEQIFSKAKRIFFLGFGYQDENLQNLGMVSGLFKNKVVVYGTAFGQTNNEIRKIKEKLKITLSDANGNKSNFFSNIYIEDCDCCGLLRKYL